MRGKAVKKDSISIDILPPRPNRALRSLLSVALSSRWAKTVYHNYSKNIINQIKIVLDMGYTSILDGCCYAEYLHINKHTFGARENIYYLLSLIHYLLSKRLIVFLSTDTNAMDFHYLPKNAYNLVHHLCQTEPVAGAAAVFGC